MNTFAPLAACVTLVLATGVARAEDPPVPPGRDPGGIAVVLISTGIDYTAVDVAPHLARDGEGEIMGYDFVDDDRRPFGVGGDETAAARTILAEAPAARLAPVRVSPTDPKSLGQAAVFAGQTPARIALVTVDGAGPDAWAPFRQGASRFDHVLFVLSAGDTNKDLDQGGPPALGPGNLIVVTASDRGGTLAAGANFGAKTVDIAAPGTSLESTGAPHPTGAAAARVAALAARIAALEPPLDGAALKKRLLDFAAPPPNGVKLATRSGWIADPARGP